jgi:hypothetical protein
VDCLANFCVGYPILFYKINKNERVHFFAELTSLSALKRTIAVSYNGDII